MCRIPRKSHRLSPGYPPCLHQSLLTCRPHLCYHPPPQHSDYISSNSIFHQKHPGVLNHSDSFDRIWYPLTENHTLSVAQATGRVEYLPPLLCARNVMTYTHHRNDMCVTLFAGAPVIVQLFTQHLAMCMPCPSRVPHCTSPLLLDTGCSTLPIYVQICDVVTY